MFTGSRLAAATIFVVATSSLAAVLVVRLVVSLLFAL